jgi:class 3 adenylate cyclase/tetratricopeptide (TPR) repeat protein
MGTEAWVESMNRVLQSLEREIYRLGGVVDQFRGDGLVAFFGATAAHEDDPERAVLASLALHRAFEPLATELAEQQGLQMRLRVGVNTGEVVIANIGNRRQHSEDTAMGEAIALAARMETAAEPGTVLVTQHTYRLVEPHFEWLPLGELAVKGLSQPIPVYRPVAPLVEPERPSSELAFGLPIPLIGRDAEFDTLQHSVDQLLAGRGGIVLVSGDQGMGKSFLVSEVQQHFERCCALLEEAQGPDLPPPAYPTWLLGRCRSFEQAWPYSMWRSLLRNWLGIRRGEPTHEAQERLYSYSAELWGDHLADHYPYLATLLSVPLDNSFAERIEHLDADGLRQQFFLSIRDWVQRMARRGPLVLVSADAHWADATSLELLKYCLPLCEQESVLWLTVFRPERASPVWGFRHFVETEYPHRLTAVGLQSLTPEQSAEFLNRLIGAQVLPDEMQALILSKAEGNPYYIAELVRSLIAQGLLVQDDGTGRWRAASAVTDLELPDSLQTLLLARIDSLSPEQRQVLQMAAVIGPVFWHDVLAALAGDAIPLHEHLTALQRARLIEERERIPDLGREYVFRSNLLREVVYEGLLASQRATYHLRVAEYLEQVLGERALPQFYSPLAYHFRGACECRKELFYTLLGAEQAKKVYANAEALERYNRAVELLAELEPEAQDEGAHYAIHSQRFEVLDGRREVYLLTGDAEAARTDALTLLELARQLEEDPRWLIDALLRQPGVGTWQTREELQAGLCTAQEALALAQRLGDQRREMQSLFVISRQHLFLNEPGWEEADERALALARELGDRRYEALVLTEMGTAYAWSDQPQRSMAYLEAALPISRALDDMITEVHLLSQIGMGAEREGDYYRLLTQFHQERLRISREIGYRQGESDALVSCGQAQGIYLGDYETGLALAEKGKSLGDSILGRSFGLHALLSVLLRIIQLHMLRGRYDAALEYLETAQQLWQGDTHPILGAGLRLVSGLLYQAMGDEDHLRQALDLAAETRRMVDEGRVTRQFGIAAGCVAAATHLALTQAVRDEETCQTHRPQALEASQYALDIYQHFGYLQVVECVSEEVFFRHSQALAANGYVEEAATYLDRAHAEMMRKYELIPADSPFRQSYLENIPLHRDISLAYAAARP